MLISDYICSKNDFKRWIIEKVRYMYQIWLEIDSEFPEENILQINQLINQNSGIETLNLDYWVKEMGKIGLNRLNKGEG